MRIKYIKLFGLNPKKKLLVLFLIYIFVGAVFVKYLLTFDIFNTQVFIKSASYLYISQNPYLFYPNQFPPNFFLFLLPTFLMYVKSGYNIFIYIETLKIIQMLFSAITAYITYLFILHYSTNQSRAIVGFTAILFSPVLFWVNFIQLEQSPIGIMFTFISLYAILVIANREKGRFLILLAGTVMLWYSAFLYLIPIALMPSLLIYQKTKRESIEFLFAMAISFSIFYIPFTFFNMFDIIGGTAAISAVGSSGVGFTIVGLLGPHIWPPDSFQLFLKEIFTMFFVPLVFLIPIFLRFLKRGNVFLSMIFALVTLFLLLTISNLDEFSWVLPFLVLYSAVILNEKRLFSKLLLVQLYDFPYIFLFIVGGSIFNTNGSGIFYLSYLQFHLDINLDLYPWAPITTKILVLLGFIFFVFLILLLLNKDKNKHKDNFAINQFERIGDSSEILHEFSNPKNLYKNNRESEHEIIHYIHSKQKILRFTLSLVILAILISSFFVPLVTHNNIDSKKGNYPFGFFTSEVVVGNSTYQFSHNYKSIDICPTTSKYNYPPISPLIFSRNVTGESISMNISLKANKFNNQILNTTIFRVGNVSVNLFNEIFTPKKFFMLFPNETTGISALPITNKSIPILNFTGNSSLFYDINISNFPKNGLYFFFNVSNKSNVSQQQIMYAKINNTLIQFFAVPNSNLYILSQTIDNKWVVIHNYQFSNNLNIFNIKVDNGSLFVNINNSGTYQIILNTNISLHRLEFSIGKDFIYPAFNYIYALEGKASPLFETTCESFITSPELLITMKGQNKTEYSIINSLNFTFSKSFGQYTIRSGNNIINWTSQDRVVCFGRLSQLSIPITISINGLDISSEYPGTILITVALLTFFLPGLCLSYLYYKRRE